MPDQSVIDELRDDEEYRAVLKQVRRFFECEPHAGTPEAAHFDKLVLLIEQYEVQHFKLT